MALMTAPLDAPCPKPRPARETDELTLFRRLRATGDPDAREALVHRYLPLARHLARRYEARGPHHDDLLQTASLGLVKAVDGFDPDRGAAFSTYAVPTIVGELKRYFRDSTWAVRVPRGLQERVLRLERTERALHARLGRSATVPELARALDCTAEELLDTLQAAQAYHAAPLDARGDGDDEGRSYADTVGEEDGRFDLIEKADSIAPALRALPERERQVLQMRFCDDLTQAEIALHIGVSQMQVSRLLRRSLTRLQTVAAGTPAG